VSYDLYIINPDGAERHLHTNYVRAVNLGKNTYLYYFEDSGVDWDYNDVVIKVDKSTCSRILVTVLHESSHWKHQIRVKLFYDGSILDNILLWANSKMQEGDVAEIDLSKYAKPCVAEAELKIGDLIKAPEFETVYYYGSDGKRHTFPSRGTYDSWYHGDFSMVKKVTLNQLSGLVMGYNMTYKPGVRMLKIQSIPDVYAVDSNATLRLVTSEAVAQALYGLNWNKYIDDLSPAFYTDYKIGLPINQASDFPADLLPVISVPVATPVAKPSTQCHSAVVLTEDLIMGKRGEQVLAVQNLLKCLGYFPANVTANGYFGQSTHDAVVKFQQANNLLAQGRVGPQTRALLNEY
jgi:hypothetical protein